MFLTSYNKHDDDETQILSLFTAYVCYREIKHTYLLGTPLENTSILQRHKFSLMTGHLGPIMGPTEKIKTNKRLHHFIYNNYYAYSGTSSGLTFNFLKERKNEQDERTHNMM